MLINCILDPMTDLRLLIDQYGGAVAHENGTRIKLTAAQARQMLEQIKYGLPVTIKLTKSQIGSGAFADLKSVVIKAISTPMFKEIVKRANPKEIAETIKQTIVDPVSRVISGGALTTTFSPDMIKHLIAIVDETDMPTKTREHVLNELQNGRGDVIIQFLGYMMGRGLFE
ncbi:TPA_asm: hypothetical protein [Capsaspora MELD virus 2]|nr:TPA_asm: hypothetical protein [Capsaspora MELD virus 2]